MGQQETVWARIAMDRECWMTLAEGHPAMEQHSPEQNRTEKNSIEQSRM